MARFTVIAFVVAAAATPVCAASAATPAQETLANTKQLTIDTAELKRSAQDSRQDVAKLSGDVAHADATIARAREEFSAKLAALEKLTRDHREKDLWDIVATWFPLLATLATLVVMWITLHAEKTRRREDLLSNQRLKVYTALFARLQKYPESAPNNWRPDMGNLPKAMTDWYYVDGGGLVMGRPRIKCSTRPDA
jgi:hypothetical protein